MAPPTTVSSSTVPRCMTSFPTAMLIGPGVPTLANPLLVFACSSAPISSPGHPRDNRWYLIPAQRRSIVPWPTASPSLVGYDNSSPNCIAPHFELRWCTAIMSARCISRLTRCSISGRSMSKSIFTLFVIALPSMKPRFFTFRLPRSSRISSPSGYHHRYFVTFEPVSTSRCNHRAGTSGS